jgi:uncharacterized protein
MFGDDPGVLEKRKQLRPDHLEHVIKNTHSIIASGGLFPDDEDFANGGLIILDTKVRREAIDYIENDPFSLNEVFSKYTIKRWRKAVFDHKRISI